MFTLEINLNTNTSTFTLSPLPSISLLPHESLLDTVGMQNIQQKNFCFSMGQVSALSLVYPFSSYFHFCFSKDKRCLRLLCLISSLNPQIYPLDRHYFAKIIFYCFIYTCIDVLRISSIGKRNRWMLLWLYSLYFIKYLGVGFFLLLDATELILPNPSTHTYTKRIPVKIKCKLMSVVLAGTCICVQVCLRNIRI